MNQRYIFSDWDQNPVFCILISDTFYCCFLLTALTANFSTEDLVFIVNQTCYTFVHSYHLLQGQRAKFNTALGLNISSSKLKRGCKRKERKNLHVFYDICYQHAVEEYPFSQMYFLDYLSNPQNSV